MRKRKVNENFGSLPRYQYRKPTISNIPSSNAEKILIPEMVRDMGANPIGYENARRSSRENLL